MGIDAEILFKNRGQRLTEEEILRKSYELATALGHENFWIDESHHALGEVEKAEGESWCDPGDVGKVVWYQDGPPIYAEEGEQFIRAFVWSRYYGVGYERGDWGLIRSVCEWGIVQGWEAWYGGDSSGVVLQRVDEEFLTGMTLYFYSQGHRPYQSGFGSLGPKHVECECPRCKEKMYNVGGGGDRTFFSCGGCGARAVVRPGETVWLKKNEAWS